MAYIVKLTTSYENIFNQLNQLSKATQIHCSIIDYFTNLHKTLLLFVEK